MDGDWVKSSRNKISKGFSLSWLFRTDCVNNNATLCIHWVSVADFHFSFAIWRNISLESWRDSWCTGSWNSLTLRSTLTNRVPQAYGFVFIYLTVKPWETFLMWTHCGRRQQKVTLWKRNHCIKEIFWVQFKFKLSLIHSSCGI